MNRNNFFDKNKSKYIKGFAIVLMLIHHLFAFNSRIENVNYISILSIRGQTIENYIGIFAKICVPIYLFVSGYGLYYCYKEKVEYKSILKRALNILKIYWIIMILFLIIGIMIGKREFNFIEFVQNVLTISSSYNGEWWFLNTYIILLILFPFIKKFVDKVSAKNILFISIGILGMEIVAGKLLSYNTISSILILKLLLNAISSQSSFILGCIFCKLNIFGYISYRFKNSIFENSIIQILVMFLCIALRGKSYIVDFIMIPIFIYSISICIEKLKLDNIFKFLGEHSTNIWLTHSFFCYHYFQKLTFMPKLSLLIILWLIMLSLISSFVVNFILRIQIVKKGNKLSLNN